MFGLRVLGASLLSRQCPDSACKQDLLAAYLQRIALYCHQLNICSKVKAEVQNLGGELVVSGVILPVSGEDVLGEAPEFPSRRLRATRLVTAKALTAWPLPFCFCGKEYFYPPFFPLERK